MPNKKVIAFGTDAADQPLHKMEIVRRELRDNDIEIEMLYCGICHSDLHTIHNDWKSTTFPVVPGHEMIGRVTRIGKSVTKFQVGDLAGIGCIVDSCGKCEECKRGEEQFCVKGYILSFNGPDEVLGGTTYGGFSQAYVCKEDYVVKVPPFKDLAAAAPILCAGITVYSPLKHWGAGPGKQIGLVGIGGLGHMAIQIAKAMGATLTVFTTSPSKKEDALKLGADRVVLSTDRNEMKACPKLDMILDTVSAVHNVNIYLNKLKTDGSLVLVGLPAEPLSVGAFNLITNRKSFSGSNIGGIRETQEVLDFCYKHNIVSQCEIIAMDQVNEAFERLQKNDVKYRFVIDMKTL